MLERFIEVNFDGINEELVQKINGLKSKVNLTIGKDIEKDTVKLLREKEMNSPYQFFSCREWLHEKYEGERSSLSEIPRW